MGRPQGAPVPSPTLPRRTRPGQARLHRPAALPAFLEALLPSSASAAEVAAKVALVALVTDPALAKGAKGGKAARAKVEAAIDACIAAAGKGSTPATARSKGINGGKKVERWRERERGAEGGLVSLSNLAFHHSISLSPPTLSPLPVLASAGVCERACESGTLSLPLTLSLSLEREKGGTERAGRVTLSSQPSIPFHPFTPLSSGKPLALGRARFSFSLSLSLSLSPSSLSKPQSGSSSGRPKRRP